MVGNIFINLLARFIIMKDNVKEYVKIMDSLGVRQMVLQGPPGTSKTYTAKEIIKASLGKKLEEDLIKKDSKENDSKDEWIGHWAMVQFHPSYGYEDFVRGITIKTSDSTIKYETVNKIFGKMCEIAQKSKKEKFFLLIDEINRADIATVFGELIYALEYRDESVEVPYELEKNENSSETSAQENLSKLSVPDNLYIIATMNTADKSVGNIDYAIRRRFLFFDLLPDENVIRKDRGLVDEKDDTVTKTFKGINKFIKDATKDSQYRANDFKIGHTYFLGCKNDQIFHYKMQYQVLPILREYYIDGIIKEQKDYNNLNKYLNGDDLNPISLIKIIREFEK